MNARYAWQAPLVVVIGTSQAHKWRIKIDAYGSGGSVYPFG